MNVLERFSLKGKVIVITGGTGVLGGSFVKAIAEAGAKLCIIGRSEEKALERVRLAESYGAEAIAVVADVMDEQSMILAKDVILRKWGTIDGLVNAAGGNIPGATIGPDQDLFDNKISDTIKAIELNLYGTIIPTLVLGEVIAKRGSGAIVNISSLTAKRPFTRVLGYTVAKHGIDGFTKWMAAELALRYSDKVRVNAIAPGVFLTEQNRSLLTKEDGSYTDRAQRIVNGTPFSRLGDPSELEGTLIYLLSDAASFISGETVFVDGGFNAWTGV
ncbi:SDR family oxidoreductase [Sphingobacterium psychroaquaticum]|uniref:NAD(P)-dependent dehydrogenase, short-chain alcohol dehydrogenase family n=1 Tax=Sphingobacterium psychroaquaticum TaxID=561061 RepID=A0A1X7J3R3_9SPHI|nr:SDR family oxidoreductase [Sphingobacterium psychroaquaticum]QBQ40130.1 SDR family oxidoreductase [Sphingobacterium psychroaquaticum]SMG21955.1 NAD(P)-dependent dehydrogenase, short-chain alcohol dehydrogenase family [Sphingobacterium psychroaquaticum]